MPLWIDDEAGQEEQGQKERKKERKDSGDSMGGRGQNPKSDLRMKVWTLFFKIFASGGGWEKKERKLLGGTRAKYQDFRTFPCGAFLFFTDVPRDSVGITAPPVPPPRAPYPPSIDPKWPMDAFFYPGGGLAPLSASLMGGLTPPGNINPRLQTISPSI